MSAQNTIKSTSDFKKVIKRVSEKYPEIYIKEINTDKDHVRIWEFSKMKKRIQNSGNSVLMLTQIILNMRLIERCRGIAASLISQMSSVSQP
jgi:hypothetical protein